VVTFGAFFEAMMDDIEGGFKNDKHRKQWYSSIRTHASQLLPKPIASVNVDDVLEVLRPIWLKIPETASRVRGRIERVLDAARVKGHRVGDNPARWSNNLELLLPRKKQSGEAHHAALSFADMPSFMAKLRQREGGAAKALQFTILTAARSSETLGCIWKEVDLSTKIWTVPAERMKAGLEHQVPLSAAALALLETVRLTEADPESPIFANKPGTALSNMAMAMLLRRLNYSSITVHGFRSSFRDWAGETTQFPREDVEMALAHTIGSKAERAYRRGRALEKRRELMAEWADHCSSV
jgi:integrase